nr:transmembrane protein 107 isoform X3 [Pelodiscus sinensis]|eukprot:XP_025037066.1 transmembrane protein 107 isoform X3 [Pelodiscus sinensis]
MSVPHCPCSTASSSMSARTWSTDPHRLVVALSVTLGLFAVELAGFLSGISMFNNTQSLLSTGAHASAAVALLFFLFEQWESSLYWWIFAFCSALPAAFEILLFVSVFGFKRKPL